MFRKSIVLVVFATTFNFAAQAAQSGLDEAVAEVGHRWAKVSYHTPDSDKEAAFRSLVGEAEQVSQSFPDRAEPLVWRAIVLASAAKAEGGLGALSKAKEARDLLLAAEKLNPNAMTGSIYSTLGSLYAKVPGWPIGFGDKKKAKDYFEKALAINPNGIDVNYFYGDYLAGLGEYAKAAEHLQKALAAPARAGREDADNGRRQDVRSLLEEIKQKHGDQLALK